MGSATVPANGRHGGPIEVSLGGKVYRGQWSYVAAGGAVSFGTAVGFSGGQTSTATATGFSLPTGGNGTVLAAASDGTTLRCVFYFSEIDLRGTGECQDSTGEIYDLQIS
jgi:hypothetical protein